MKCCTARTPGFHPPCLLRFAIALVAIPFIACEDGSVDNVSTPSTFSTSTQQEEAPAPAQRERPIQLGEGRERLEDIRDRGDDAFAAMDQAFATSETRAGPQPWPIDLPEAWPRLPHATVVADTKQAAGNRLLLVDLPGLPDRARHAYREALRANGYRINPSTSPERANALHVEKANHRAVLTFFPRETVTRVEILFLSVAAG